ncbi:MAG: anti-sigma factor antagonist [Phycisphaerales bacterium]|nr:MAG: anti-sigma factor antagonist [Phycisphaerales bacterium]
MSDSSATGTGESVFARSKFAEGVLMVKLVGPSIGQREGPIIAQTIRDDLQKLPAPPRVTVLHFGDVTFLNSTGLGMCIELHNEFKQRKIRLILYRIAPEILSVLKMTKMDRLFTIIDDPKKLEKELAKKK